MSSKILSSSNMFGLNWRAEKSSVPLRRGGIPSTGSRVAGVRRIGAAGGRKHSSRHAARNELLSLYMQPPCIRACSSGTSTGCLSNRAVVSAEETETSIGVAVVLFPGYTGRSDRFVAALLGTPVPLIFCRVMSLQSSDCPLKKHSWEYCPKRGERRSFTRVKP